MKKLNKLRLFFYQVFMVFNPIILIVAFFISFFSDKYAVSVLGFLHWFFVITLLLAIPQLYNNYKNNSR
jgi:hypothetical protein